MASFEEQLLNLLRDASACWVDSTNCSRIDIPKCLQGNVRALHLLNHALNLVREELLKSEYHEPSESERKMQMVYRYALSWELFPGVRCKSQSFHALDVEFYETEIEAAIRSNTNVFIVGRSGQGKTTIVRNVIRKLSKTVIIYIQLDKIARRLEAVFEVLLDFNSEAILVLDNASTKHKDLLQSLVTKKQFKSICVITSSDNLHESLRSQMLTIILKSPTESELWKLQRYIATTFWNWRFKLPELGRTRKAVVGDLQSSLVKSELWSKRLYVSRDEVQKRKSSASLEGANSPSMTESN